MSAHDIVSIASPISCKVTKEINGMWYADMRILPDDYIGVENYVDIDGEEYIVKSLKKIKSGGQYYYDVNLYHNMSELADLTIDRFSYLKSVSDLLTLLLAGSGWTAGTVDITETVSLITDRRTTILEALNNLAEKCNGELYYHSKTRIVDLKREIGTNTGLHIRYDKNADYIEKEQNSSDLVTRIYPLGSDNYTLNTLTVDDCEDETLYVASGAGTKVASTLKQVGSQGIEIKPAALNETFIRDLGAGGVKDLTGYTSLKFWIYSATDNAAGLTFGIGESAYTEITVNTGALTAENWYQITKDISGVASASKNAIRYIGFKNLTNGAADVVFDRIEAFNGNVYIDSVNASLYKIKKEYVYNHSAKVKKTQFEAIIYPSDDSYVRQLAGNSNFGTSAMIGTYNINPTTAPDPHAVLVKFPLTAIPSGATIVSVELDMYAAYVYSDNSSIALSQLAADWSESTVTWNNKPAAGASIGTLSMGTGIGHKTFNLITALSAWYAGSVSNYGIYMMMTSESSAWFFSKEGSIKPFIKVVYSMASDPSAVILAAATQFLIDHEEPALFYKVKMADLSKVMIDTWEDETIDIGDTVRIYDKDLDLNVSVRIKKIIRDLLNPENISIELANRAYTIADIEARKAKQLSYAMPFEDNKTIINANSIQTGYFGSLVNQ